MGWEIALVALVGAAVFALPFVVLYLRRRWLTGQGGLFDCAYRLRDDPAGGGWALGVARFRDDKLEWYRAFSLSLRPKVVFRRASTSYVHQRQPAGVEAIALFENSVVVSVKDRVTERVSSLSMARDEVVALMSWLESAPPGSHYLPASADSPL